ncbi:SDR family oxidoreductase [Halobacteriovorax sp. HLS]|uniref:SDR family oxidoreductase n=1 Tax=Halobacteriovorax sp. HLS TaxID=2234000 RepID=UPI000FD903FD|nr:SDR family oxidoreductase [Halobacteriovorax sp. HLS]
MIREKIAIVTGSEGQIGSGYVKTLQGLGYNVYGFDIKESSSIKNINYCKIDITNKSEVDQIIKEICSKGDILILVNNAGVSVFSPFEERTEDELDYVISTNIKANIFLTQSVYKHSMSKIKKGKIVNIGSIYGQVAGDMNLYKEGDRRTPEIYGATKAAIINLTKYFAAYMAPNNVQVNCISPGGIFNNQDPEFVKKYERKTPSSRMGSVDDLQKTIEYLVDFNNNHTTGQNITVDGGFTIW